MLRSGVIEYRKQVKETQEFELIYKEGVDALPSPRTLNTHVYLRMLPKQVVEKKIKCIQIMRNPKNACVSFFNQHIDTLAPVGFEGDLAEFTEIYLSGQMFSYSDYLLTWKAELAISPGQPVLELVYEDMKLRSRLPIGKRQMMLRMTTSGMEPKRRPNLTEEERLTLVDEVRRKEERLFGRFRGCGGKRGAAMKEEAWEEAMAALNAKSSQIKRTVEEGKKQYANLKQRAKEKNDAIRRPKTGGGPKPASPTMPEAAILETMGGRATLSGLAGGIDTEGITYFN
ncbi:uncharacterized protein LOC124270667 [Haliotis rubra]|uniref:uncharacterized protein LOC124270667 n=1 Tax=Haliotis rubra TaxID=36100 RepID=UPI001EE55AAD|nr:uncharacterized protein LOC124270667 [Haliotis rubra]